MKFQVQVNSLDELYKIYGEWVLLRERQKKEAVRGETIAHNKELQEFYQRNNVTPLNDEPVKEEPGADH